MPHSMRLSPWKQVATAGAVLTVLAIAATWPIASNPARLAVIEPTENDFRLNTYLIFWGAHALLTDPLAVHHTNMFHPERYTFVYADILLAHSLLMLPVIEAFYEPILTYNLLLIASLVIGGLGFFCLARAVVGHPGAALLGALLWAFNPVHFTRYQQIQLVGDHWLPWMAWALWLWLQPATAEPGAARGASGAATASTAGERRTHARPESAACRQRPPVRLRYAVAAAVFFCLNALSGSHHAVFGALLAGSMIAYFAVVHRLYRRPDLVRLARGGAVFALIAVAVLAPIFWPYLAIEEQMAARRAETLDLPNASLWPLELLSARSHFYRWLDERWGWPAVLNRSDREVRSYAFPGLVTIGLAGLALLRPAGGRRRTDRRFWLFSGLLFLFLAMGAYGGYLLVGNLPLIRLIRVPIRYMMPATLCLAMLASFGAAALAARIPRRRARIAVFAALALAFSVEASFAPLRTWPYERQPRPINAFLAGQPGDFAIVEFPLSPFSTSINARQVWESIFHWKRLLVGYSGYQSPANVDLLRSIRDGFPSDACIDELVGLDVRFVIVLEDRVEPELLAAIAAQPRLLQAWSGDGRVVYRVEGRPVGAASGLR